MILTFATVFFILAIVFFVMSAAAVPGFGWSDLGRACVVAAFAFGAHIA